MNDELDKARFEIERLRGELAELEGVEEVNRSLVKRGDHYKAKAETARSDALEEAAKVVEQELSAELGSEIAEIIRALKEKP